MPWQPPTSIVVGRYLTVVTLTNSETIGNGDTTTDSLERSRRQRGPRSAGGIPAELVVSNHVMGLYELAAIHLGRAAIADRGGAGVDAVGICSSRRRIDTGSLSTSPGVRADQERR